MLPEPPLIIRHLGLQQYNSSKGSWQAMTVVIEATGKPQLDSIFAALKTSPRVKMVL